MQLTRRFFLRSTGLLTAYLGVSPLKALSALPSVVPRQVKRNKTLVVIFLRGGVDGLNFIVPYGDKSYSSLRPSLGLGAPGSGDNAVLDLDGFFGLHPRLLPLLPSFDSELAVALHAVGYDRNTRSHFEEQDVWETGIIGNTIHSDGWLNRHLATSEGHGKIRAVAVGDTLPRILRGKVPTHAIRGLSDLSLADGVKGDKIAAALEHAYSAPTKTQGSDAKDLLRQTTGSTLDILRELDSVTADGYQPKATYPPGELSRRLQQVAQLIKANIGLEVAEVDYDGWDTHREQGRGSGGTFGNLVGGLAQALAAFTQDIESHLSDVVVATLSDFGRTAAENGSRGTDHGWANSMLLLGGPIQSANRRARSAGKPRKVITRWPGLAPDQLHQERDLLHTTDFRDVLSEIVRVHLGNENLEAVLPNHRFQNVGALVS